MVCESCSKKLGKIATIDPYRTKFRNEGLGPIARAGNENKILTTKKDRYQPYSKEFKKCRICKTQVHQVGSNYCQQCAYQKAICAICGKKLANTKKYKMSSV
ncbi:hypothetical protein AB6A40_004300 [Gnathostoma spinigerum]|uniref:Cysteine-rich PDZ-binding protein n=1 Tax=Gnathostoma spinigerum TaxID=75299 RepID=A0ABD6EJK3_9BILA